ncbi:MAG: RagB/SusD family nutrient uptake outer membrane protein [Bacteroidales bacterium]|nr:RagB/SusD family nutrient uptake outer membrane protein [Bacteroidales bacterium]
MAAGGSAVFTGCDDFLDEPVVGNPLDENSYDTKYKLQSVLNSAYDKLACETMQDSDWRFGEATADNMVGNDEGLTSHMGQLVNFRFNTSNSYILSRWTVYYQAIHRVNQVIANIHKCRVLDTETDTYREIRYIYGQAKFLRAYFYFNLVRTFGGVPIRPEVENVSNTVIPRSSLEECYAYIEKDLREAAIMLPSRFTLTQCGKASAGAATALLMKVLMYQAKPGDGSDKWKQCAELGDYFVKGEPFTFAQMLRFDERYKDTDWETLREELWFKPVAALKPDESPETLEEQCPYLKSAYSLKFLDAYMNAITYDEQWYEVGEFCQGSVFEIVYKESGDGTSGDTNEGNSVFLSLFPLNNFNPPLKTNNILVDRVFGTDVRTNFIMGHNEQNPDGHNNLIGMGNRLPLKWYTPIKDRPVYTNDNAKNRRVIRFMEVVLTYAEALNEVGRMQEALEQLNSVQTQVNSINNGSKLSVAGGYGYLRNEIWLEREKELAFEWDRFFDIVRQGRAASMMRAFSEVVNNHRGQFFREGVNEIFPIPQTEIDVSNGVVEQNPGY